MADPLVLYSSALLVALLLSLALAVMAFFRLGVPGAMAFLFGNLASFAYTLGSLFEIHAQTADQALSALTVEYLGIATIGPLLFLTAISSTRGAAVVRPIYSGLLFVVPLLTILAVSTNDYHHLFYTSIQLTREGPFAVPVLGKGPLYMVNFLYMNVCLFWGVLIALREARRGQGRHRMPLRLLLLASLLPWIGMLVYQLGWSPWHLDTAPFGLALAGVVLAVALFRYQLFDLQPLVLDQVFENMSEAALVLDLKGRLLGLNPALTRIVPEITSELVGTPLAELARQVSTLEVLLDERLTADLVVEGPQGRRVFQVERSPLLDRKRQRVGDILLLADITVRVDLANKLERIARTDELTGLPNRRAFLEQLEREHERLSRYGGALSLAIGDIDHFKRVNDTWGHEAGDLTLQHLAKLWSGCLRASDHLARYGGEEFVVLLPGTGTDEAQVLLERMRRVVEANPLALAGQQIALTASFVLTTAKSDTKAEVWVRQADAALYQAKEAGRNRIVVDKSGTSV